MGNESIFKVEHLSKIYGGVKALDDLTLEIGSGFTAITGRSGSGKSTLLSLLGTLEKADEGKIWFCNQLLSDKNEKELSDFRNKQIGFIFQTYELEPLYSVYNNVELPMIIAGVNAKERKERVESLLNQVGLFSMRAKKTGALSGGEQQRAAIARAFANDPSVILADEPCGNLDSKNSETIMDILQESAKSKTVILITHNAEDAKRCSRNIVLCDGKVVSDTTC